MWYKLAIQGIIQHQVSDQDIDSLVDQSVMDLGEKYLINQMQLKNGLMSMFPNLKDVLFEDSAESLGEYILELSAIAIPTEIAKNQLNALKATLHHELQHLQDPRMQKMPEKVKQLSDEANLANYIGIQKVNENTSFPSYEETIEKIFESFIGRRSNPSDEKFLNEIKAKYTPELYQRVMQRIQAGDHPYFNSELEKPANLKDFRIMFSASNLMGIKDLVSKDPSYTNEKHIELISNVLRNPSSKRFNTLESLLIQKYPEFSETYDPSFLKEMNTNPKYERQFYKQLGNIINELQQLSESEKGN
jgi:choline kinase